MIANSIVAFDITGESPLIASDATGNKLSSDSPHEILRFLRFSHSGVLRVFWDLDEAIAPLLRLLPKEVLESLAKFDDNTTYGEHQLYYLPDRMFRIGKSRFFGLKTWWPTDYPAPESLEQTQSMADNLLKELLSILRQQEVRKLTSPIACFEDTEFGQRFYQSLPKGYDIPEDCYEALQYAYKAGLREWITAYQLGHWGPNEIWDYDCTACYPSLAAELPDIRGMKVWNADRIMNADFGFVYGKMNINPNKSHLSPIMQGSTNYAGELPEDYYTLDEVMFVLENNIGKFNMLDGWYLIAKDTPAYPFKAIMNKLYLIRSKSDLSANIAKGIANQLVGKLAETRVNGDYGPIRNDIYHATILARARIKVAQFLIDNNVHPNELIVVQTDGCKLTRHISFDNNGMGSWRCKGTAPTLVASPYKVYVDDKKPGHLTYNDIVSMINEHPLSAYYGTTVKHRTTLKQAIEQGDISLVGKLDDLPAHLDLNSTPREQNRIFSKLPKTGQSLLNNKYTSQPCTV